MRNDVKPGLLMALETACNDSGETGFRDDYSGRGMYGDSCVGITGSLSDCMRVIAYVIQALTDELENADEDNRFAARRLFDNQIEALMNFSQDSMGRDLILYWSDLSSEPVTTDE